MKVRVMYHAGFWRTVATLGKALGDSASAEVAIPEGMVHLNTTIRRLKDGYRFLFGLTKIENLKRFPNHPPLDEVVEVDVTGFEPDRVITWDILPTGEELLRMRSS